MNGMRVAAACCALTLGVAGCGGGEDRPPTDLGPMTDTNVSPDLGRDQGMIVALCDGPPGLYVAGSCTELAPGVRRFRPRFQLWSDAAEKERFVFIPDGTTIDNSDPDAWVFPVGTIFWKTFSRGGRRLETRILTKTAAGEGMDSWTFEAYGWNLMQDDVTRVSVDGLQNVLGTTHDIPSREDCLGCHAAATRDVALGFGSIQLADVNLPLSLDDLAAAGDLGTSIAMSDAQVPGTTVQRNALGYLHANCAHCHGGAAPQVGLNMQLLTGQTTVCETNTYVTALAATDSMGTCMAPGADALWSGAAKRVLPGNHLMSAIYLRMAARGSAAQMPPLGTEDADAIGLMAIQAWIMSGI